MRLSLIETGQWSSSWPPLKEIAMFRQRVPIYARRPPSGTLPGLPKRHLSRVLSSECRSLLDEWHAKRSTLSAARSACKKLGAVFCLRLSSSTERPFVGHLPSLICSRCERIIGRHHSLLEPKTSIIRPMTFCDAVHSSRIRCMQ